MAADVDAILFDLDSTLTDRSASIIKYAGLFQRHFHARLKPIALERLVLAIEEVDANGYAPRVQVFNEMSRMDCWLSLTDVQEISEHWMTFFAGCAAAPEDMHETLATLVDRGYRLGMITNGSSKSQRTKIECLGIEKYLDTVVISKEVGYAKPDPAIFVHAVESLRIEAGRCLFVGDHPINDVSGADQAGLVPVWLEGTFPWPDKVPLPPRKISRLSDLLALMSDKGGKSKS